MKTSPLLRPLLGIALLAGATLACLSPAQAGLVLEQTVEGSEASGETVMRIQNGMLRADICEELSTIADFKAREVMTLMHPAREVTVMRQPQANAGDASATPVPKYTVTGQKEVVNGHECEIVTMEVMGITSTYWVARTYPDYDKIKAELAMVKAPGQSTATPPEMEGFILKSCTGSPGYPCITTVKSVRFEEIPASTFQPPAGYTVTRTVEQ